MRNRLIIITVALLILVSCDKNSVKPVDIGSLKGAWIEQSDDNNKTIYTKSITLADDVAGVEFKENGKFVKNIQSNNCIENSGVESFYGEWEKVDDNKLKLFINENEQNNTYTFTVLSLDGENLEASILPYNFDLIGIWSYDFVDEGGASVVLKKVNQFDEDNHGIQFFENGDFVQRQINSWCGTPPVTYENYNGTWAYSENNIVDIEAQYWGGTENYQLEILSVDNTQLRLKYIYEQND